MTIPAGIYWTAVVFGESTMAIDSTVLADIQPYKMSVMSAISDMSVMPPRISAMQAWATMSASGSGGGTAECVMTIQSHISTAPYVAALLEITSSMSTVGLPNQPNININKPAVQRASTW